ncbi:sulfite exporter TauE/SafE family protein [Demequina sp. NBRC 110052]|uniref:sulfite exporter TauE/SafE family protein n=1 Tax=Demequina sp. NBRC 110052 TaxID=1570341 RepID=UPI0009FDD126|nr:sulfite exporter TauE/SafE family protein [Demequina sp. NBRC 110052]
MLPDLPTAAWVLLAAGAAVVGISKTALPGASTLSIAAFAAVLPARQSTGTLLALLIVGDVFALWAYRRHADWGALVRLVPAVIAGVLLGVAFLALADDDAVRRVIGVTLLLLIAFTLWRRRTSAPERPHGGRVLYGTLGGFTTMVANAGGPVMSMYFLAARFPVKTFLGTAAWFFAIVNIAKLPFSISLGLLTPSGLLLDLVLIPAVLVGAFGGRLIAERLDQAVFEAMVIVLTVIGAAYLLV